MKSIYLMSVSAAVGLLVAIAPQTMGAVSYQYVAGATNYTVNTNGSVSVPISLVETFTGGDTSLIGSESGLSGAGFSVTQSGNVGSGSATLTDITGNASFNLQPNKNVSSTAVSLLEGIFFVSPVTGTAATTTRTVPLGTVTISAANLAAVTTYTVGLYGGTAIATTTSAHNYNLDVTNNGGTPPPAYSGATTSTFTVTTLVPEPASLACLAALGGFALRRRRA